MPNFCATSIPWTVSSAGVVLDGNTIPYNLSLPNASKARYAASVESIPPLRPRTIPSVFDSSTFD